MLVFNEREYGETLLKNGYQTSKNQGRERCILVRYLRSIGYDDNLITEEIDRMPFSGKEYLSSSDLEYIYGKILLKSSEFDYMCDININIYKKEIDIITNIKDISIRNLLFVILVYYKWALNGKHLYFENKKDNKIWVVENDSDIFKEAGLFKLRKDKRYDKFRYLIENKLYISDIVGKRGMFYLPFIENSGDIVLNINNYNNILGWLYYYLGEYKLCKKCGVPIEITGNKKMYCSCCASGITRKNKLLFKQKRKIKTVDL